MVWVIAPPLASVAVTLIDGLVPGLFGQSAT
jgi:hypothetical protein